MQKPNSIYERALNLGNLDIWEWNIKEESLLIYGNSEGISKYGEKALKSPYEFINTFTLKDDRAGALNDLNIYMNGGSEMYRSEMRIELNGEVKWVLIQGKAFESEGELEYISGTILDITYRKQIESEIGLFIYYDALTGLPNRAWLMENFKNMFSHDCKNGSNLAVIFIDISNLNAINNSYGYEIGDIFLKLFSQLIGACKRKEDSIFRFDGDEFILFMPNVESKKQVTEACRNILEYCKNPFEVRDKKIFISLSMGVAFYPKDTPDISDVIKYANLAMYKAKEKGKNNIVYFESYMGDSYIRKLAIEHELKNGIKNNEFYLLFQPQFDVSANRIIGFEALLRWNSSMLGVVSPGEFIPIAEKTGDIVDIGNFVIIKTASKIKELLDEGCKFECISLNVSPFQLRKRNFLKNIIRIFEEKNIPLNMLEIEITEGTLIDTHLDKLSVFNEMIEKGIRIAIDDFGTGYSSLNYLTMLPISTLKIDKSFIDKIYDKKNRAVIESIINLSGLMKYRVLAEGVETKNQLDLLRESGCEIIQGYYFSKPISENEIVPMLNIYNDGGKHLEKSI